MERARCPQRASAAAEGDGAGAARAALGRLDGEPRRRAARPSPSAREHADADPPRRHQRARPRRSRPRPASPPAACSPPASRGNAARRSSPPPRPTASPRPRSRPTSAPRPSSTPPTRPATCPGSWSPRSAGSSPTTAAPTATCSTTTGVATPGHLRRRAQRHATAPPQIGDTDAGQYDDDAALRPRGRADAVHPLDLVGRRAWTPTATASATRRTSTTPRSAPPSTSAPAPTTSSTDAGPAGRGLPLQPQPAYVDLVLSIMDGLPRRRLHLGAQRHRDGRRAHQDPAAAARARHSDRRSAPRSRDHRPTHGQPRRRSTWRRPRTHDTAGGGTHRPARRRHRAAAAAPAVATAAASTPSTARPAAAHDRRPAGRPDADPGAGDAPVHARRLDSSTAGVPTAQELHEPVRPAPCRWLSGRGPQRAARSTPTCSAAPTRRTTRPDWSSSTSPASADARATRPRHALPAATTSTPRSTGCAAASVTIEHEPHVIFSHADDTLGPAGTDEWQAFVRDSEGNLVGPEQNTACCSGTHRLRVEASDASASERRVERLDGRRLTSAVAGRPRRPSRSAPRRRRRGGSR